MVFRPVGSVDGPVRWLQGKAPLQSRCHQDVPGPVDAKLHKMLHTAQREYEAPGTLASQQGETWGRKGLLVGSPEPPGGGPTGLSQLLKPSTANVPGPR